jgi:hypothetical protein
MGPHRLATSWRCHGIALLEPAQPFRSFSVAGADALPTCATLPADVEATRYGPQHSALVGLLGVPFP